MGKRKKQSRIEETIDLTKAEEILNSYEGVDGALIPVLQKIQNEYGYIQEETANLVAERMNISASEIIGVATFYSQFRLEPIGVHMIN
jgi:NADH-quinone oxidoreductase subunit E